jgi:hypothetical protein
VKSKNIYCLFTLLIVLSISSCIPYGFSLPGEIELPSLAALEREFDLPVIHIETSERSTSFQQKCIDDTTLELTGSGTSRVETRTVDHFSEVVLAGLGSIQLVQGEQPGVTVQADANLLPYLETKVERDQLKLGIADGVCIRQSEVGVNYFVTVKDLDLLHIIGVGDVQLDRLDVKTLRIQLDGSAHIAMSALQVGLLETLFNGTGAIELAGNVDSQFVNLNGIGQYQAGDLISNSAHIKLNGTGNVEVWTIDNLQVEMNGIGTVSYFGDPELSTSTSGLAGIMRLGEKKDMNVSGGILVK